MGLEKKLNAYITFVFPNLYSFIRSVVLYIILLYLGNLGEKRGLIFL